MSADANVSPDRFLDQLLGFQKTAALKAAIALDLFSAIGKGSETASALATRTGAAERGVRILCDFLVVNGHLEKGGERLPADTVVGSISRSRVAGVLDERGRISRCTRGDRALPRRPGFLRAQRRLAGTVERRAGG